MSGRRVVAAIIAGAMLLAPAAWIVNVLSDDGLDATPPPTSARVSPAPLPDVTLSDLDGQAVALRTLTGRPTVLNFWYSTCPPCDAELPAFAGVATELADRVRFVGINPQDSAAVARQFASDRGVTYDQLLDKTHRAVDAFKLTGFPTTVLVTADGRVALVHRDELTASELRALIVEHLLT